MKTTLLISLVLLGLQSIYAAETFSELYQKARKKSYSLKAELSKLEATNAGVSIAKAKLYPSLHLSSSLSGNKGLDAGAGPTSVNLSSGLQLSQVIYDRSVYYSIKLSKLDAKKNQLVFEDQERKFAVAFAQLYITVLTNRIQYLLLQKQYDIIDELINQAHVQGANDEIKEALWTRLDPLSVMVNQSKTVFENSVSKLKSLCGINQLDKVFYADDSYNFVANQKMGRTKLLSKLISDAMTYNRDIQMGIINSNSQYKRYEIEKLPPISLRAFAGVTNHQMGLNHSSVEQNEASAGIMFSIDWEFGRKKKKEQQQKLYEASLAELDDLKEAVRGMLGDTVNNLFSAYDSYQRLNAIDARFHATKSRVQIAREGLDDLVDNFSSYSKDLGLTNSKLSALGSYIHTVLQDKQIKQSILVEELNIIQLTGKLNIQGVIAEINKVLKDPYPLDSYEP